MTGAADRKSNSSAYWRFLKCLNGKRVSSPPNQPIKFGDKTLTKSSSIAKSFCRQYGNAKEWKQDKESRRIYKSLKMNNRLDRDFTPFSEQDTIDAIKESKNSSWLGLRHGWLSPRSGADGQTENHSRANARDNYFCTLLTLFTTSPAHSLWFYMRPN